MYAKNKALLMICFVLSSVFLLLGCKTVGKKSIYRPLEVVRVENPSWKDYGPHIEEVAKRIEGYGEKFSPNWNLGEIRDRIKKTSDVDSKKEKTQIKTLLDRTSVSLKIRPFENEAKALIRIEF